MLPRDKTLEEIQRCHASHHPLLPLALTALSLSSGLSSAVAKPAVEVAFVLDTTGSMGGLIEGAKRKIWSIATAIVDSNPDADIRMGLVAYRDIGDDYVTKKVDLTTDIQDLYANLLELKARGGGDWPESVNEALDVAVNKLQWTSAATPGGSCSWSATRRRTWTTRRTPNIRSRCRWRKQKDIIVNAVLAGDARDTERVWRDIAQNGNGRFIPIPQDGGQVVIIETPYDEDIIILQREINGTVIPYGPRAMQKRTEGKTKQLSRGRRRRAGAGLGDGELSQQALQGDVRSRDRRRRPRRRRHCRPQQLSAIKEEDLPDNLRAMKPEQRMRRSQQADEPAQGAQRKAGGAGGQARQIRRRPARQGAAESVVVRPRRRGYAEGADQAVR